MPTHTSQLHRVLRARAERVHRAFTEALETCCLGWQESLAQLDTRVEPSIPG